MYLHTVPKMYFFQMNHIRLNINTICWTIDSQSFDIQNKFIQAITIRKSFEEWKPRKELASARILFLCPGYEM